MFSQRIVYFRLKNSLGGRAFAVPPVQGFTRIPSTSRGLCTDGASGRTSGLSAAVGVISTITFACSDMKDRTQKALVRLEQTYDNSELRRVLRVIEEQFTKLCDNPDGVNISFMDQIMLSVAEQFFAEKLISGKPVTDMIFLQHAQYFLACSDAVYSGADTFVPGLDDVQIHMPEPYFTVAEPSFFIATSSATESVIVTIRGTADLGDMLTSMLMQDSAPRILQETGDAVQFHDGVLRSAEYVLRHIRETLPVYLEACPRKKVVFTGHSLGGGIAQVCGLLLREEYFVAGVQDIDIEVYSFAAPPVIREADKQAVGLQVEKRLTARVGATPLPKEPLFCRNLAGIKNLKVYNFILDKDIVCYLSAPNLVRLMSALRRIGALEWSLEKKLLYIFELEANNPDSFLASLRSDLAGEALRNLSQSQVSMPDFRWHHHVMIPGEYYQLKSPDAESGYTCLACKGDPGREPIPLAWRDMNLRVHTAGMYKEAIDKVIEAGNK